MASFDAQRKALALGRAAAVSVRDAEPSDHERIRDLLAAAYRQFASALEPAVYDRYIADILDLEARTRAGDLLVAERAGRIVGTVTFYGEARSEGFGWPPGWAGLRALGVDPAARGLGVGRLLMEACVDRARRSGATVLCLHTSEVMTAAVALYETMGFRRLPSFDFTVGRPRTDGQPVTVIAYRLDL
jgi:predicted N-acetyltransferase YhbS